MTPMDFATALGTSENVDQAKTPFSFQGFLEDQKLVFKGATVALSSACFWNYSPKIVFLSCGMIWTIPASNRIHFLYQLTF